MKRAVCIIFIFLTVCPTFAAVDISDLELTGAIDGENVTFTLSFDAEVTGKDSKIRLVDGDVAYLEGRYSKGAKVSKNGKSFYLYLPPSKKGWGTKKALTNNVEFKFASLPEKDGEWRQTRFKIPDSIVRKLTMVCDRDDLEVVFPGAMRTKREKVEQGPTTVTAFLGVNNEFVVRWKPEVKKLDGELVVSCDANTIASASVGALRQNTLYTYRIVQGALENLSIKIPENVNIIQVRGTDIRRWVIGEERELNIELSRPQHSDYTLEIDSELVLPAFPADFNLPVLQPLGVIRTSGFLLTGTDSAIKLQVPTSSGLTQIDQSAFPVIGKDRSRPRHTAFTYQYANMPFTLNLSADDIVTAYSVEERMVLTVEDNDLTFDTDMELDVRDAPAREVIIETSPEWIVSNVAGAELADYDVRDVAGKRLVYVYFKDGVMGRTLVKLRLERSLSTNSSEFVVPNIAIPAAKSERGFLVLSGDQGLQMQPKDFENLREVHPGSLPVNIRNAQSAWRFKSANWHLAINLQTSKSSIYSEVFHLVSLGDGVLYGSSAITYHVNGSPVRGFQIKIPKEYQNVEFVGRDVRSTTVSNNIWTVTLQEKVIGDYTMLVTYDRQFADEGDTLPIGAIEMLDTESEIGYIALSGSAKMSIEQEVAVNPNVIPIERLEIPYAYRLLINAPVLSAFKYVSAPHDAVVKVKRLPTQSLLKQVADHTVLRTRLSEAGEAVTTIQYFIKNTSSQYLGISLPADSRLWTARVDQQDVQVLDAHDESEQILIPLNRHRDPNLPSVVEVTYAQSAGDLEALSRLQLAAPRSAAQSVFARWYLELPEGYSATGYEGNMDPEQKVAKLGLSAFFRVAGASLQRVVEHASSWLVLVGGLYVILWLAAWHSRRKRIMGLILMLIPVFMFTLMSVGGFRLPGWHELKIIGHPLSNLEEPVSQTAFSKVVNLADSGLQVALRVAPEWLGSGGSILWLSVLCAAGFVLMLFTALSSRGRVFLQAAGGTLVICGLTFSNTTLPVALILVLGLSPILLLVRTFLYALRNGPAPELVAESPENASPVSPPPARANNAGYVRMEWLGMLLVILFSSTLVWAKSSAPPKADPLPEPPDPVVVMDNVLLSVSVPKEDAAENRVATVVAEYEFNAEADRCVPLLKAPGVLVDYVVDGKRAKIGRDEKGYELHVVESGRFKIRLEYLLPVQVEQQAHFVNLFLPDTLRNKVVLRVPDLNLDVRSSETVLLKSEETEMGTETTAVFKPVSDIRLQWHPQVRRTHNEQAVFYCEMNSLAVFEGGVVNLTHLVGYQIAQGEVQKLTFTIPEGMSVTAVNGKDLSTWRYDPETHVLEALLNKPVSSAYQLTLVTQVAVDSVPYKTEIALPAISGANRQRGAMAIAAGASVQVRLEDSQGLHTMNISDFPVGAIQQGKAHSGTGSQVEVKRALKYHQLPAQATVLVEKILPEARVVETAHLDVSDERMVLTTQLKLSVEKAGIFSTVVGLPENFEVESLTGKQVSHWDELKSSTNAITVHFKQQILGDHQINIVLSHTAKGVGEMFSVPRIEMDDVLKHTGVLTISAEQGVRLSTSSKSGVSELNPRDLGINLPGYLAYRVLRPGWDVTLAAEVVDASVSADVVQKVLLSDGIIQGKCFVVYRIDGAGEKMFRLQSPAPGTVLSIFGDDIAKVEEIDAATGIWEVNLRNKVQSTYRLEVNYQVSVDMSDDVVVVNPVQTLGETGQKGYLAILSGNRLQIRPETVDPSLREEDARNIPGEFGAGDLSDSILCYRTTRSDFQLQLRMQRHQSAAVLPATVQQVNIDSVVSEDDQMVSRVRLQMQIGDLRFLPTRLPQGSQIWSVQVNGKPTTPLVQGGDLLIPLDAGTARSSVEFIYGGTYLPRKKDNKQREVDGPKFGLPLTAIEWHLYLPEKYRYYDFDGSMQYRDDVEKTIHTYDTSVYTEDARRKSDESLHKAEEVMRLGTEYAREGRHAAAKKAFEAAMYFSQGQDDFNEDARIQYRNLARRQAVAGLVNRRGELKKRTYGQDREEATITTKESEALDQLAERLIDQQAAASQVASTINVSLPVSGKKLEFHRALQIQPFAPMTISYKVAPEHRVDAGWAVAGIGGVFLLLLLGFAPNKSRR